MALSTLFAGRPIGPMHDQLRRFAAGFGVTMHLADHIPNTRRALALAEHARSHGALDRVREALMDAHWTDGRDIEADDVLREAARAAGLDPEAALTAADSAEMQARVDVLGVEAKRWGVTGIPTYFLLPDGWSPGQPAPANGTRPVRIVGCQPYETVAAGCMQAGIDRRR